MWVESRIRRWLTGSGADPSVRVRFWTDVDGRSSEDPRVRRTASQIGRTGWAATLLENQLSEGQWAAPGTSDVQLLRPRFASTHWITMVLSDLGMTRSDARIRRSAELLLAWRRRVLRAQDGELCFAGNATRTLIRFGYLEHPVVQRSIRWIVAAQKADGGWTCFRGSRSGSLDGWEGLAALAEIPESDRDPATRRSVERGAEFYLSRELRKAAGPRYAPWYRIRYPTHYYYDLLVGLRVLTRLGYGADPRLRPAVRWLRSKRRADGSWALDGVHPVTDLEEGPFVFRRPVYPLALEPPDRPSRWATVEALSVLRRVPGA